MNVGNASGTSRWKRSLESMPEVSWRNVLFCVPCHRFEARCGGSEFTLGDDSSDVLEMVVCVLMLQILSTVGVLDVAATLMKRPSSSETI